MGDILKVWDENNSTWISIPAIQGEPGPKGDKGDTGTISALDAYPVGSIYMTVQDIHPAELFGGDWTPITGRFLLAATDGGSSGASQAAGNTGGEATHTLTGAESGQKALTNVGSHHHPAYYRRMAANSYVTSGGAIVWGSSTNNSGTWDTNNATFSISASNATSAHNNMPPYLAVYMWKRLA